MNKVLKLFLIAGTFTIFSPLDAVADSFPPIPFLMVEGHAKAEVPPDKATMNINVSAFDPQSAVAAETVQKQLVALIAVLVKHSIPEDAITAHNLAKNVERARKDRNEMEILGYHVSRSVKVELLELSVYSKLAADIAKLDNVVTVATDFDVTNRDSIELTLMSEAGADARRTADNMIGGMSRKIARVYALSESSISSSVGTFRFGSDRAHRLAMSSYGKPYQETIFEPSTIDLRQSISVMFELE